MKKLVLFLLVLTLGLASCSSDDKDSKKSLNGTVWQQKDGSVTTTFTFSENTCKYVIRAGILSETLNYTYTYNHPTVNMTALDAGMANLRGTVTGTALEVVNISTNKTIGTFVKQ